MVLQTYGIQKFTDSGAAITTLRHCMNEAAQREMFLLEKITPFPWIQAKVYTRRLNYFVITICLRSGFSTKRPQGNLTPYTT